MDAKEIDKTSGFRRKVYTKMYNSSISLLKADTDKPLKKIIPTSKKPGLREEFKKTFLPLLIDVFELRQMIQTHRNSKDSSPILPLGQKPIPPEEILQKLQLLQEEIAESKRWVEGVITQIDKAIQEAQEALQAIDSQAPKTKEEEKKSLGEKIKLELGELLDQKSSAGRLFSRFFKKKKSK